MTEKLIAYDPAAALVDDEEIAFFMADAVETGDSRQHRTSILRSVAF
jgi:DNA-binding phage protein